MMLQQTRPRTALERAAGMTRAEAQQVLRKMVTSATFEWLSLAAMKVDPRAQRLIRPTWVKRHVHVFDPNQIGVLCVSRRSDGTLWIIDGQHRVELLRAVGWGDQSLYCEVFSSLSIREEAALFLSRNDRLSVRSFDKFKAACTAEHGAETAIAKIVSACGLKIAEGDGEGSVAAVTALRRVYQGAGMASDGEGSAALRRALQTIQGAWDRAAKNYNAHVIEALGLVFLRYGTGIDQSRVIGTLAKLPGGAAKLVQQGKGLREQFGGTVPYNIADAVVIAYNRGHRRAAKLERWRS